MNKSNLVKTAIVLGSISAIIYGSYNGYCLYQQARDKEDSVKEYEKKYINHFIRKVSRINK